MCKSPAFQKHCPYTVFLAYPYLQLDKEDKELPFDTQALQPFFTNQGITLQEIKRGHRLIILCSTKYTFQETLVIHKDLSDNHEGLFLFIISYLCYLISDINEHFACKGGWKLPQPPVLGAGGKNWQGSRWTALTPLYLGEEWWWWRLPREEEVSAFFKTRSLWILLSWP